MDFADDLEMFYAEGAVVSTGSGADFRAFLSVADVTAFDGPQVGDYLLQYPASHALSLNQSITVNGQGYRLAEHPRRIGDGLECVVGLMRESA